MAAEQRDRTLADEVEVDGAFFGGYVKPENRKEDRKDRRLKENRTGKREAVVVMRQRNGNSITLASQNEADAVEAIVARVSSPAPPSWPTKRPAGTS